MLTHAIPALDRPTDNAVFAAPESIRSDQVTPSRTYFLRCRVFNLRARGQHGRKVTNLEGKRANNRTLNIQFRRICHVRNNRVFPRLQFPQLSRGNEGKRAGWSRCHKCYRYIEFRFSDEKFLKMLALSPSGIEGKRANFFCTIFYREPCHAIVSPSCPHFSKLHPRGQEGNRSGDRIANLQEGKRARDRISSE